MSGILYQKICPLILYLFWTSRSVLSQEMGNDQNRGSRDAALGSSYFYYQHADYPRDCSQARGGCSPSDLSGVNLIKPDGYPEPFEVYCDNLEDSRGWTVIYRIQDGAVFLNRSWTNYKTGFGFPSQEFWLGNDKLSFLTNQNTYELRIELTSADGLSFYVTYNRFRISDDYSEYKLISVGEYNGTEDDVNRFLCPLGMESSFVYVSPTCSKRCSCTYGQFTCDDSYQCSTHAVCEDGNNGSQCQCNAGYVGDGVNCTPDTPPSDCQDVYDRASNVSGVYKIKPVGWQGDPFDVYCNMSDGGGWTVFQRRVDGSQDFHLYWSDYKIGFGTPDRELWLGNEKLHKLTTQKSYELRIDLVNSLGNPNYAKYSSFGLSDENDNYRLSVGSYSEGDAVDQLHYNDGFPFTTRDRDNDGRTDVNCAVDSEYTSCGSRCYWNAGWWYDWCGNTFLNSPYGTGCFFWRGLPGGGCNIKYTEMKIRPI